MKKLKKEERQSGLKKARNAKASSVTGSKKERKTSEKEPPGAKTITPEDTGAWEDKGDPIYAAVSDKRPGL